MLLIVSVLEGDYFLHIFGAAALGSCLNLIVSPTGRMIRGGTYNAKGKN